MDAKEFLALQEAYTQIYQPQELTEEVEIATEYFYEMGINENGIDILIEELGEEEFINWIYDISEEYTLSEADQTRLQKMAAAKGKIVTGPKGSRPQSTTKAAIQKMGGTTKRIGSSQRPGSTISGKRREAVSTAVSQQKPSSSTPQQTKKGMGGLIGSIVQRAKQDTALFGKSIQTARDVASRRGAEVAAGYSALRAKGREAEQSAAATRARRKATVVAGRAAQVAGRTAIKAAGAAGAAAGAGVAARKKGATSAQTAGRVAGTFVGKMREDVYDIILSHLLDEGYASTVKDAEAIMVNMSEDWKNSIIG